MHCDRKGCVATLSLTLLNAGFGTLLGFHHHTNSLFTIDLDANRIVETDMSHERCFLYRRDAFEPCLIEETIVLQEWVHREVTYPEGCEILEEVGALTRLDAVVLQPLLHDHPRL